MVGKKRIGIVFSNDDNWIGGTYYILNLISAINTLEDDKKPYIIIFSDDKNTKQNPTILNYPYLTFHKLSFHYNIIERMINKFSRILFNKNLLIKKHPKQIADIIFPYNFEISLAKIPHKLAWIPDLQEYFLNDFFTAQVFELRKNHHLKMIGQGLPIVFSSKEAESNFKEIYKEAANKTFVVNFAVTHPPYENLDMNELKDKYKITKPYFISPNQFWKHKNHQIILEAVRFLKTKEIDFQIVFTGKEYDFRYPEYANELKKFVSENDLTEDILFLGFIDRKEQLQLMNNSIAVIQPSLFEGWSTVVEDAKAMDKLIILSDIAVHREQIQGNVFFFNPENFENLGNIFNNFSQDSKPVNRNHYDMNVIKFGIDFIKTCNLLMNVEETY